VLLLSFAVLRSARDNTLAVDEEDMTVGYMELDSQGAAQHEERSEMNLVMLTFMASETAFARDKPRLMKLTLLGTRLCGNLTGALTIRLHACLETTTAELTFSTSPVFFNQEHTLRLSESCCSVFRLLSASSTPSQLILHRLQNVYCSVRIR